MSDYDIIFTRRHPELSEKESTWQLIYDSYRGGIDYKNGGYLYRYPKESEKSYSARNKRAVYFNQIQPLADIISGFLFMAEPQRSGIEPVKFIIDDANRKKKTMNEFISIISTYSMLFTVGILVDAPNFDKDEIKTEAQRKENNINPYCVMYTPFDIRDFNVDDNGELNWILLDNSYYKNDDPLKEGETVKIYRLWTREYHQDFEYIEETSEDSIKVYEQVKHNIEYVPFKFVNWRDDDSDFVGESVFEDPAMISQLIYNKMSEMDEMLASGSFKVLMYPTETGELPSSIIQGGIGSLSAIGYDGNFPTPTFDGASLQEVEPFLKAIEFYIAEILKKVGLETDQEKDYVQSGIAKQIDFQKVKSLLTQGANMMEKTEKWIYATAGRWLTKEVNAEVNYNINYTNEDISSRMESLTSLLTFPIKSLKKTVMELLVSMVLSGDVDQDRIDEITKEINKPETVVDINELTQIEQGEENEDEQETD